MRQIRGLWIPDLEREMIPDIEKTGGWHVDRLLIALESMKRTGRNPTKLRVAVDVGAHVGCWSIALSGVCQRVIAIEPTLETRECLNRNIKPYSNIDVCSEVISDVNNCALEAQCGGNQGKFSTGGVWYSPEVMGKDYKMSRTLDSLLLSDYNFANNPVIDLIKIDVEGAEPLVLRGATEILKRNKPMVIWENKPKFAPRYGWNPQTGGPAAILTKLGARQLNKVKSDEVWGWPV